MTYNIELEQIDGITAEKLCRNITADLPEYFGIPSSNEQYAIGVHSCNNFAAKIAENYVALLSLGNQYPTNSNLYWLGILQKYHRNGIGQKLIQMACNFAKKQGKQTISVDTLAPQENDDNYLKTYKFYEACGFKALFNLKSSGNQHSMVYMIKSLDNELDNLVLLEHDIRNNFGFNWSNQEMIIEHAISECNEIKLAILNKEPSSRVQEEIGDLLHVTISLCLSSGFDVHETLNKIVEKFNLRMNLLKTVAQNHGLQHLKGQPIDFVMKLWREVKKILKT